MGKLISIVDTARRLGMTEQTMRNWIKNGIFNVKSIGKSKYIDEDTINALQDTIEDVEFSRKALERVRDGYYEERRRIHDDKDRDRVVRFLFTNGRTRFIEIVIRMLDVCGELKSREAAMLIEYLNGEYLEDIGYTYGCTRERVRQIVEKAIRKSIVLTVFSEKLERLEDLEAENGMLKARAASMERRLLEYEKPAEPVDKSLCDTLSTKLSDCPLSTRALNALHAGLWDNRFCFGKNDSRYIVPPCETLGDVCRLSKQDILKLRNMGKRTVCEIEDFLEASGLSFEMDVDKYYVNT